MHRPLLSKRWIQAVTIILFFIGMVLTIYFKTWWPGILLTLGLPLAFKQFLEKRRWNALFTLIVFVGFFALARFNIPWKVLLTVLFVMAVIYILCREWLEGHFSFKKEKKEDEEKKID